MNPQSFIKNLRDDLEPILIHTICTVAAIVCIRIVELAIHNTKVEDKFFDLIPLKYIVQVGDFIIIISLWVSLIKYAIRRAFK